MVNKYKMGMHDSPQSLGIHVFLVKIAIPVQTKKFRDENAKHVSKEQ